MARPNKKYNQSVNQQSKQTSTSDKKPSFSEKFLGSLKDSLLTFSQLNEEERISTYGDRAFLDQFWDYVQDHVPGVLDGIAKEDLPACIEALEKKGFSLSILMDRCDALHQEFAPEKPEREVMQETLSSFKTFCHTPINAIPSGLFEKFSQELGFDATHCSIPSSSSLRTIDDIYALWKAFIEKEGIVLKDNQKKNIEILLCPQYNPTERIVVEVAIGKLAKELPRTLKLDFTKRFPAKLDAFSPFSNLRVFARERRLFLDDHAHEIDEPLAKKLDSIIVTNGDIKTLLAQSGRKYDHTAGFQEWERYFLRVFNKLATRQLFEEITETKKAIDAYIDVIAMGVKGFPPYVNELFLLYPYHDQLVSAAVPTFHQQLSTLDGSLQSLELRIADAKTSPEERSRLLAERQDLLSQKAQIKRQAYVQYLSTKDKHLSTVVAKLVDARFDFSLLSLSDQQEVLNILVKRKLHDLMQHKAPELLDVDADQLATFVDDLFDLQKQDLLLPTRNGPVHIRFTKKSFVSAAAMSFLDIGTVSELQNLPLQFEIEMTPSAQEFFEQSSLWGANGGQLFHTFASKNGPKVLNDGYQVTLRKGGASLTGYLSQYPPTDVDVPSSGTSWYMYSSPVTAVSTERTRLSRADGTPVEISEKEESDYDLQINTRSFALNGEVIGSLIFAYVLGQQAMVQRMLPAEEKQLAEKIQKLTPFVDTQDKRALSSSLSDEGGEKKVSAPKETQEEQDYKDFLEERKHLMGYAFPEDKETHGFVPGTKIFVETGETTLPPDTTGGSTRMWLDIVKIDKKKGTFTVKMHSGELSLGGYEGTEKEIPLSSRAMDQMKDILGKSMYKVPSFDGQDIKTTLEMVKKSGFGERYRDNFGSTFDLLSWNRHGYTFASGDFAGKEVVAFGQDVEEYTFAEGRTQTIKKSVHYKVEYLTTGKVKVSYDGKDGFSWNRVMDYASFILFVAGKRLEPQASLETKTATEQDVDPSKPDRYPKRKSLKFSINNIKSFFKNSVGKIKDSIKKYDEDRAEELTDLMLANGNNLVKLGKLWSGLSGRIGSSIENAGMEYYTTRDSRIWKKIEKWQKFYEQDAHYASFFFAHLNPMIEGKEIPKDIYKIPAMLLTIINKEKDPYARNPQLIGTGHWVNLLLGKDVQKKYLELLNKKKDEMRQGSALNGSQWTVMKNEEIIKLEMKFIISVIDGREHNLGGDMETYQAAKWSRAFANKLDEALGKYGFGETDKKANEIPMSTTFEFAEFEFSRNIKTNKIAGALPNLKAMAKLAQTEKQWEVFQMHIVSCILSGCFWWAIDASAKGWIKDICRTRGFIPGLWAKDINQQSKIKKMLDIYSHNGFSIDLNAFTFGTMGNFGKFVHEDFKKWWFDKNNGHSFCKFLEMTGANVDGKTLIDLSQDPQMPHDQRSLLQEYIDMGDQTSEDIDKDVRRNSSALKGTPFTKCEAVVKEMLKYDGQEFAGEDSAEKAGPAEFWTNVAHGIPAGKLSSQSRIQFFMRKFMNRFGGYGFEGGQQPIVFLKRLRTVQQMYALGKYQEADDMLRYIINGTIIQGNSYGKNSPPQQFLAALDAFKVFFKNHLSEILSPTIVAGTLGDFYARDPESGHAYALGDWKEYMSTTRMKGMSLAGLSQEERQEYNAIKQKYQPPEYEIYHDLYRLAENLEDRHGMRNSFKKYYISKTAVSDDLDLKPIRNATGVAIKNPRSQKTTSHNSTPSQDIAQTLMDDDDFSDEIGYN